MTTTNLFKRVLLATTAVAAPIAVGWCIYKMKRDAQRSAHVDELLLNSADLLEEYVENDLISVQSTGEEFTFIEAGGFSVGTAPNLVNTQPEDTVVGPVTYKSPNLEVTDHLVVKNRTPFMRSLIHEAKNRFGCPARNHANLLAVRKFCLDRMSKANVRPTHVAQLLPTIVELVFVNSDSELEAKELIACWAVARRNGLANGLTRCMANLAYSVFGKRA